MNEIEKQIQHKSRNSISFLASINTSISIWLKNISNKWENFIHNTGPKGVARKMARRDRMLKLLLIKWRFKIGTGSRWWLIKSYSLVIAMELASQWHKQLFFVWFLFVNLFLTGLHYTFGHFVRPIVWLRPNMMDEGVHLTLWFNGVLVGVSFWFPNPFLKKKT